MKRSEDSLNTEEIVNLRLELFRAKNKADAYDKSLQRNEMYEQIVGKLVDVLQERYAAIQHIANSLGVKSVGRAKDFSELKNVKVMKEGDRTAIVKYERLSAELDVQEELLGKISEEVVRVAKHNRETSLQLEEITKIHNKCGTPDTHSKDIEERLRRLEKEIS